MFIDLHAFSKRWRSPHCLGLLSAAQTDAHCTPRRATDLWLPEAPRSARRHFGHRERPALNQGSQDIRIARISPFGAQNTATVAKLRIAVARSAQSSYIRSATSPDAPAKTGVTKVRNRQCLSICTRSPSTGEVHTAWVCCQPPKPTRTAPHGALIESPLARMAVRTHKRTVRDAQSIVGSSIVPPKE